MLNSIFKFKNSEMFLVKLLYNFVLELKFENAKYNNKDTKKWKVIKDQ